MTVKSEEAKRNAATCWESPNKHSAPQVPLALAAAKNHQERLCNDMEAVQIGHSKLWSNSQLIDSTSRQSPTALGSFCQRDCFVLSLDISGSQALERCSIAFNHINKRSHIGLQHRWSPPVIAVAATAGDAVDTTHTGTKRTFITSSLPSSRRGPSPSSQCGLQHCPPRCLAPLEGCG